MYLHIRADFDENGLSSKIWTSLDDFVADKLCGDFDNYVELENYINECKESDEEPEYHPKYLYDLINDGEAEGEWDAEEFYEIKGTASQGIV